MVSDPSRGDFTSLQNTPIYQTPILYVISTTTKYGFKMHSSEEHFVKDLIYISNRHGRVSKILVEDHQLITYLVMTQFFDDGSLNI